MKIKVRIYDYPNHQGNYEDCVFTAKYTEEGDLSGYEYKRKKSHGGCWYGSNIYNTDIKIGLLLELENITPEKTVPEFNFL